MRNRKLLVLATILALVIAALASFATVFTLPLWAHAAPNVTQIMNGGTGTSTAPTYGKVLIGGPNGEYELVASSTFGVTSAVTSFNGRTGAVTPQSGDYTTSLVPEGTNLYWTQARFDAALSATTSLPKITTLASLSLPYSQLTGTPDLSGYFTLASWYATTSAGQLTSLPHLSLPYSQLTGTPDLTQYLTLSAWYGTTTDQLKEGTSNLYFTNARADARFVTDLAATTSVKSITTLPSLSLPVSQVTGLSGTYPISYSGGAISIVATSSFGCTVSCFASHNISQWTNDAGYLTSLAGAASSTLLGDNNTFSGIDKFTNSSSDFAGTWQTLSPSHFQVAGTYLTALGNYATTTGTTLSLSTTTATVSGLTYGLQIVPAANAITFTPTISGTYNGQAGSVANALTLNNGGAGASSGSTYNGSSAVTISYNSIGAVPTSRNLNTSYPLAGGGALSGDLSLTFNGLSTTSPWTAGQLAYAVNGNTVTSVATTSVGCSGFISCTGFTALGAASTIGITGQLGVANGGTGAAAFGQGWINSSGGTTALSASTSPTVNYITATSTTHASWLPYASTTALSGTNLCIGTDCRAAWPAGTVTSVTGGWPIISSGGATPNITWVGIATSSNAVTGNVPYFSGVNTLANMATGTITCTGTASCGTGSYVLGANLTISGTGSATGLGTTSPWTNGQVAYVTSNGGVTSVATSSLAFSGPFNGYSALGALVGGSASTIGWTGLATTSQPSTGNLLYSTGAAGVAGVATSTLTASSPLTGSFAQVGSGGSLGCQTASGSQAGCLSSADWTTFNNKQGTISGTWPITFSANTVGWGGIATSSALSTSQVLYATGVNTIASAATSSVTCSGLISCTGLVNLGGAVSITTTATSTNYWYANGNDIYNANSGNVGIGTLPSYPLDVKGFINTDNTSGYKQAGNTILYASTTGNLSLAVGATGAAAWMEATSAAIDDFAIGNQALAATPTTPTASFNEAIGLNALQVLTTGAGNTAIGLQALKTLTSGTNNVAIGRSALNMATTPSTNTAIGSNAMFDDITGANDVAIGNGALNFNQSPTTTVAVGFDAGIGQTNNIYFNQGGTYLGYESGFSLATSSDFNTFLGMQSGDNVTTGYDNILIGANPNTGGSHLTTGGNDICIAFNCILPDGTTASNELNIGNLIFATGMTATSSATTIPASLTGSVGIGTTSPSGPDASGGVMSSHSLITIQGGQNPAVTAWNTAFGGWGAQLISDNGGNLDLNDTRTGCCSNIVFANEGGTERMRVADNGAVAIGTSTAFNASGDLTLYRAGATAANSPQLTFSASTTIGGNIEALQNWTIGTNVVGGGRFEIASSSVLGTNTRFVIDGNGNVGIGTTSPGSLLAVGGAGSGLNFTAGTSTFASTGGINLIGGGCYAINGTCISGGAGGSVTAVSGTWPIVSSGGTTPAISWAGLATSSPFAANGFVYSNAAGNLVTVASSTLNLPNSALTNSTISGIALGSNLNSLSNDGATLSGSSYNGSATVSNWAINLNNPNQWLALQKFINASTSQFTATSSVWFTGVTASRPLYVDANGLVGSAGSGTSGNCVQWGANNTLGDAGSACGTGGGSGIGTIATSTGQETAGQLGYYTTTAGYPARLAPISTSTLSFSGPFSGSGWGTLVGGANSTLTWTGLATTTALVDGRLLYGSGANGVANVATSTIAFSGPFSGLGFGALVGGSNTTITWTGLSTTSALTTSNLLYASGASGVANVATTTLSVSGPLSITSTRGALVGGANATIGWSGLATSSVLAANQVLYASSITGVAGSSNHVWLNGPGWLGVGTSTPQWLLTLATSTAPQLTLTDALGAAWSMRAAGGNLYLSTTSLSTFATSSIPAFSLFGSGNPSLGIGSTTFNGQLGIGTAGSTNGSTTISAGKIQIDGYNSAGSRVCIIVNAGSALAVIAGGCTP